MVFAVANGFHAQRITVRPRMIGRTQLSIVIAKLGEEQGVGFDAIDEAMLIVDAPGPVSGQAMLQGFRLADALERSALRFLDERIDAFENLPVRALPMQTILPGVL
jgi:hypothetical protein